ncbi:MAG: 6-carboxytetrahydropterin synthase QueD [Bacteroidia bacterium]|nr:MAG: 6-carboxytetrahydropterin synthase QueD [Bacteroidia bacterium]
MIVRLTKEFAFEASHFLPGYRGRCANIHGHSYRLFVTIRGVPRDEPGHPEDGMLIDFGVLKRCVHTAVIDCLDHSLMVRGGSWAELTRLLDGRMRVVELPFQPTCENLLQWMAGRLMPLLPAGVSLFSLRLHETRTSYAEWFASEQGASG